MVFLPRPAPSPNTRTTKHVIQLFMIWHQWVPVIIVQLPSHSSLTDCSIATINQEESSLLALPSKVSSSPGERVVNPQQGTLGWRRPAGSPGSLTQIFPEMGCVQHHVMTKPQHSEGCGTSLSVQEAATSGELNKIQELTKYVSCHLNAQLR